MLPVGKKKQKKNLIEFLESLGNTSVYYPVKQTRPNGAKLRQRHIILHTQSPSSWANLCSLWSGFMGERSRKAQRAQRGPS